MFNIKSNADSLISHLNNFSDKFDKSFSRSLKAYMDDFKTRLIKERMSGRPGSKRGSGKLARSLDIRITGNLSSGMTVRLFSDLDYAGINDDGGTIVSKGKLLTIPLPGVTGTIRDYDGFFFNSKRGNLLFGQKVGKNSLRPLFVLKNRIVIPARVKSDEFFNKDERNRNRELVLSIDKALNSAFKR